MVKDIIQGESLRADRDFFGRIGHLLTDADLHESLGMPITSRPGDLWALSINSKDELRGFITSRVVGNALHLRFLYAVAPMVRKTLIHHAIASARERGLTAVYTNDKPEAPEFACAGFTFTPRARGTFGRWALGLEIDQNEQ